MRLRAFLYAMGVLPSKTLDCRVVSIGNIIAGGTGKTPMTIFVAQRIRDMGYRVVVISRGYRGRLENTGGIVSDGKTIFQGPEAAGDEPYLMARVLRDIPVVVGKRRYEAGLLAVKRFKPDVIVLDDAFQHLRLRRDLDLVLLDSRRPYGNGHMLPRGLLREPPAAVRRAQAIIFTRSDPQAGIPATPESLPAQRPVFYAAHTPKIRTIQPGTGNLLTETKQISLLKGKRIVAFSGLADNAQFFDALRKVGCTLVHTFSFSDHQRYDDSDLDRIVETAQDKGADLVVTTFKDHVKIESGKHLPVTVVAVDAVIKLAGHEDRFSRLIAEALNLELKPQR